MSGIVNSAKHALRETANSAFRGVGFVLDAPSNLLRAGVRRTWNALPLTNTEVVKNFLDNRSFETRAIAKISAATGATYALWVATGAPLFSLPILTAGASIFRATHIAQKTGQGLPSDPVAPLQETVQKIKSFQANQRSGIETHQSEPPPLPQPSEPPPFLPTGIPQNEAEWKIKANAELHTLVQNAAISSTLFFIHSSRLGLEVDSDKMVKVIQETSSRGGNFWTSYMKHFGSELGWLQWIQAGIWYFFSYKLGLVPNSIHTFMTNVVEELRCSFDDKNRITHLESGINRLLDQINLFFDVYNSAAKEYAEAKIPKGDIHYYRQKAIESLGGTSLEQLCTDFSKTLVDQFFPRLPFFETLKKNALFGWCFELLDFLIGGIINFIGRGIVKWNLPSIIQSLIETGVDATSPKNLPFTFAITETVTGLLQDLHDSTSAETSPAPFQPKKLPSAVEKLITTLDLTGSKDDPLDSQQKVRARLRKHENGSLIWLGTDKVWHRAKTKIFGRVLVESGHSLISYTAKNTEKILCQLLQLSNLAFQDRMVISQDEYKKSYTKLEKTANQTFKHLINEAMTGAPYEEQKKVFLEMYADQLQIMKAAAIECSRRAGLIQAGESRTLYTRLNQYAKALQTFIEDSPAMEANTAGDEIKKAFYESFYPFYREIPKLADAVLNIQNIQGQAERHEQIIQQLQQIDQALANLIKNIDQPASWEGSITAIRQNIPQNIPEARSFDFSLKALWDEMQIYRWAQNKSGVYANRHISNLLAMIGEFRTSVQRVCDIHTQSSAANQPLLQQKIQMLQHETQRICALADATWPARVEGEFFLKSMWLSLLANRTTPIVMDVFKRAHQFITQKDTYDASSRIVMRSVVDAYKSS